MAKIMLNGVDYSSLSTYGVSGVKGNNEETYRTGNVNLTAGDIGALPTTGGTVSGNLNINGNTQTHYLLHIIDDSTSKYGTYLVSSDKYNSACPLRINSSRVILENNTTDDTILQTSKKIHLEGDVAEINFDQKSSSTDTQTKISNNYIRVHQLNSNITSSADLKCRDFSLLYGGVKTEFYPKTDNTYTLGTSGCKWKQLFATTSVISTSDRNLKTDIEDLDDKWVEFFMLLQPKSYLFKDGESGRTHVGFISQDVEAALEQCGLTALDFAGFCKDQKIERKTETKKITHPANDENIESEWPDEKETENESPVFDEDGNPVYIYSLRYEEFIALNTMMIQKLYIQNKDFEKRLSRLEQVFNND